MPEALVISQLSKHFGGVAALSDVSLTVKEGSVHGVIGPNGSGKTTLINCISGFLDIDHGSIEFQGSEISDWGVSSRVRHGIVRTFQHPVVGSRLSVADSVLVGVHPYDRQSWLRTLIPFGLTKQSNKNEELCRASLDTFDVSRLATDVGVLPYGQQRMVGLARAMVATHPKVILIDEPSAGLGQDGLVHVIQYIAKLRARGTTVVITDHNTSLISQVCDEVSVFDHGLKIAEGTPSSVFSDERVVQAYIGAARSSAVVPSNRSKAVGSPVLEVRNVHAGYGAGAVLRGIDVTVAGGEIVALVGRNGAGKSTLLNVISGLMKPSEGTVSLDGIAVGTFSPWRIARSGIGHVPEGRGIFPALTIDENLRVGGFGVRRRSVFQKRMQLVRELFPILDERSGQYAGTLSGGEQQMLAIARALMIEPKVLLLDEPSLGLAPIIAEEVFDLIQQLAERGVGVLVVEQNATLALRYAHRCAVLAEGKVVANEDTNMELDRNDLAAAYLGGRVE